MMSGYWLTAEEVAELLGITVRVTHKNADTGKYGEVKYEENNRQGGKNGKIRLIPLSGLPTSAQLSYLRDQNQSIPDNLEDDGWDQEPKWKRDIAGERMKIITAWEKFLFSHPGGKRTELTEEFVRTLTVINPENNFSFQTLYRWRQDYRQNGRMALVPGWGSTHREEIIDPKAWAYFDEIYGTLKKRTAADCYRELRTVAAVRGWCVPSLRTVQRKINQYPKAYWVLRREGKKEFEENCLPYMRRDLQALKGGEVWVGDGHTLDFFVKGQNGNPVRPVLSAWVDMRSAKWLGWNIDYTNNTDTVLAAFAMASLNPDIGLPYTLYLDNGRENDNIQFAYGGGHRKKTKDLEKYNEARIHSLVGQLGIETIFAIPANGRAKIIERQFGEVARLFSKRFETYCGSDNKERPEGLNDIVKDPAKLPDLQTVRELFSKWVAVERNQQPSQGQGRKNETPDQTFARTRLPIRLAPEAALRFCLMPHTRPLKVTRQGVSLFDADYYDDKLIEHLDEKVIVRYRNEDLSKVIVCTLDEIYICDAAMKGLSHPTKATKEDYRAHKSICKKATENMKQIQEGLDDHGGIMSFPEHLDARAKHASITASTTPPEKSNVVAMVPVSHELYRSALIVDKMVVGGNNNVTYEQRKETERERNRETMNAIRRSMSMQNK